MASHVSDSPNMPKGPGSRHPNDILLYRAFSQLPPALAEATAFSSASSAPTSPAASRLHSRAGSVHGLNNLDALSTIERSRSESTEDLASLHIGLQMPTVSSIGSHSPLLHSQRQTQSPSTPKSFDRPRSSIESGIMSSIAEENRDQLDTKGIRKNKDVGMRIDVTASNGQSHGTDSADPSAGPVSMEAYSDLALTNIAFAESIQRSAALRGIAFEVHQAIYDGRYNSFLQSQRRQIQRNSGMKSDFPYPVDKEAIDEAELVHVIKQHYDANAIFENPFVLVQTPDLIAYQFKALLKFAQRTGSEMVDVTESEGYGGSHLIVMDQIMHLEIPVGPNWMWNRNAGKKRGAKDDAEKVPQGSWHDYRPSRVAKRFLQRRGLWGSSIDDNEDILPTHQKSTPHDSNVKAPGQGDVHSVSQTRNSAEGRSTPGYFGPTAGTTGTTGTTAGQFDTAMNHFATGYPFETPRATPGQSPWHTPGRRSSIKGSADSIESHLQRAGVFTPLRPPQTPGGESDAGVLSTAVFGPPSSVGPGLRFRTSAVEVPPGEEMSSSSADQTMTTRGNSTTTVGSSHAPFLHFKIRLMTRLLFNEQGKICHHEDVWGVRDVIEGLIPVAGWVYTYLGRKANGWAVGKLMGWPGHANLK